MQKLSARNKEGKHRQEPEVAITVYEPGKIRVKYNPSDHYEEFYYYAESTLDKADILLSAIAGVV